jgi:hypothetical protein
VGGVSTDEVEGNAMGEEGMEEGDEVRRWGSSFLEFSVEDVSEGFGIDVLWEGFSK